MSSGSKGYAPEEVTRDGLIALLNEDLAREYQAVISHVVYSLTLKGAQCMNVAAESERHPPGELSNALLIAGQIDDMSGQPEGTPKPVQLSSDPRDMLQFDLNAEVETIGHHRTRVRRCEALGEFALAEHIRGTLVQGAGPRNRLGQLTGRGNARCVSLDELACCTERRPKLLI
ncbi:MAG: ferritin-like domain-containing protein [Planctomycetaceae bacterium]|jgi:bacterioferritin